MPELPEVETIRRELRPLVVRRTILRARVSWPRQLRRPSLAVFRGEIRGRRIEELTRRGKFLVFQLSGQRALLIHLGMTGALFVEFRARPKDKHTRAIFELEGDQELRFVDPRKFGRIYLVADPAQITGNIGPEPLSNEFTVEVLRQLLRGRKRKLKPLLLDQTFLAGLGNIYADEALWLSRLHPLRRADRLKLPQVERLHSAIQSVLLASLGQGGTSIDPFYRRPDASQGAYQEGMAVYGREGQACPRCGRPIRRMVLGQRSTHFCARCQR
ncbi:MAG: bifunctional DNA-formamidopyrimidine glycosylase/DNA-(apurinic or apyrimidinic site) lyase [Chloroflexi bacterium]|nr:bifunctional DNA-formamidopyrimidine glycosylase/DNA-(apurinic or apyrimidinic site) lyase [Chloroflexota bacterium]